MTISKEVLRKYTNTYFVETGSFYGETIRNAIDIGFNKIVSIELSNELYEGCVKRFINDKNVILYKGDVELCLWNMIKDIEEKITFWLDAHCSGGETAMGLRFDPIIEELSIIKRHKIKTHTILIDDLRLINDKDHLYESIREINKNYLLSFEDGYVPSDILVAKV